MKLTEINDIILGNIELTKPNRFEELPDLSTEIKSAIEVCDGLYNKDHLSRTRSHTEFYEANPLMDAFLNDWWQKGNVKGFKKELFYAMLCGVYIPHVPTELVALFVFAKEKMVTPNKTIASIDKSRMKRYLTLQFHSKNGIMKDVMDTLWGYDVQLVTGVRPMVTNNGVTEIYIDNINDILLCNENIKDILTDVRDIHNMWYSKEKGIVIGEQEIPLRTMIHSFGIVEDDLDLRQVFSANETQGDIQP